MTNNEDKKEYSEWEMRCAIALAYDKCADEVIKGTYNLMGLNSQFKANATNMRTGCDEIEIFAYWQKSRD